jgi:hypothetical protein
MYPKHLNFLDDKLTYYSHIAESCEESILMHNNFVNCYKYVNIGF